MNFVIINQTQMKNLKLNLLIVFSIFFHINEMSFAQETFEWVRSYSDPGARSQTAYDITTDTNGNIYITGSNSNGYSVNDMVTIKYNALGQFQWGRTYNLSPDYTGELGKSIAVYRSGVKTYVYAAGEVAYSGLTQFIKLIKYDEYGNTMWEREFDPGVAGETDQLARVMTDAKGNCYIAGSSVTKPFFAKYDSSGNNIYNVVHNLPSGYSYAFIADMVIDAAGSIYLTGSCDTSNTKHILNLKYDSAGVFKWQKIFKTESGYQSSGRSIRIGKSGKVYMAGEQYSSATYNDYITMKFNQTTGDTIWTRKYNAPANLNDAGKVMALDANDNVYVSGMSNVGSYQNIHTLKYDSTGVQKWVKIYSGPGGYSDIVRDIVCDNSGNICITGTSDESYFGSYLAIKYNSNGDAVWTKTADIAAGEFDAATAIALDLNGNIIVTGNSGNSSTDIATIKYNSSGISQWTVKFYGAQITNDVSNEIVTDKKGNVYQVGRVRANQSGDNIQVIKYNSEGMRKWVYNRGGSYTGYNAYDEGNAITVDTLGNVYFTGTLYFHPSTGQEIVTGKLDSNGTILWFTIKSGIYGNDAGKDIALDAAGNIFVSGESTGLAGDLNYILLKYNNAGVEQWARGYGGITGSNDVPNAMTVDKFGNIFVTGTSVIGANESEIATLKFNNAGVQQWINIYNGTAAGEDNGNCIVNDIYGNAYVGGSAANTATGSDFVMIKYKNDATGTVEFVRTASRKDGDCKEEITAMVIDTTHFADTLQFVVHYAGNSCKINSNQITAVKGLYLPGISYLLNEVTDEFAIPGSVESKTYGLAIDNRDYFEGKTLYMTGTTTDNFSNKDIFVKKYKANGGHIYNSILYDGGINQFDGQDNSSNNQAAVDMNNKAYISGASYDSVQGSEMSVLKVYSESFEFDLEVFIQGLFYLNQYSEPSMKRDTITVYLRQSYAPYAIADSARGLINTNANGRFYFTNLVQGVQYYIAVKHRNSIETWSSTTRSFNNGYSTFQFYGFGAAYGNNQVRIGLPDHYRWGNFSGDVNQDNTIDASDLALIDNDATNFISGYVVTDLTGDDFVDGTDFAIADNNAANFVGAITP